MPAGCKSTTAYLIIIFGIGNYSILVWIPAFRNRSHAARFQSQDHHRTGAPTRASASIAATRMAWSYNSVRRGEPAVAVLAQPRASADQAPVQLTPLKLYEGEVAQCLDAKRHKCRVPP